MEVEKLIESFKSANQSLRKRAITIGILMIIAIALGFSEKTRSEHISELLEYEYGLDTISRLPDSSFRQVINGGGQEYFAEYTSENVMRFHLFNKVKNNDYQKSIITTAIDEIIGKIKEYNKDQSIAILGMTIPLQPVAYVSLILVLIVFHDFTQIIIFRNQVYRRIRKRNLRPWELGFEFFGFYHNTINPGLTFLKFISTIITSFLILCPAFTGYLMLDLNDSNNGYLSLLNIICFILIVIDTLIIFHTENILNFRYLCNRYLGKHNIPLGTMKVIWGGPILVILALDLITSIVLYDLHGMLGAYYFIMRLIPAVPLYFFLNLAYHSPTKINRVIRLGLILINIFWVYVCFHEVLEVHNWTMPRIWLLANFLFFTILFSSIFSFIYMIFLMSPKRRR